MLSSRVRRLRLPGLAGLAAVVVGGSLLAGCASPTVAPRSALEYFLTDVHAHSVVYAYTLLTNPAEDQTTFIAFFNGVKATKARFKIVSIHMVNAADAEATVAVLVPYESTRYVKVQMVEEGNAGDWLVNAPFVTQGASAIHLFQ